MIHNESKLRTPEYISWSAMKSRCYRVTDKSYMRYGGRGIKVCKRWLDVKKGFLNFLTDLGRRPSLNHSLDRIKANKNYTKNNCRWATPSEQGNNRTNNIFIKLYDTTYSITQACRILNIPVESVRSIKRAKKISYEKAVISYLKKHRGAITI